GAPESIMLSDASVLPEVADAAALSAKWERIRTIRADVAKAMEMVRGEGVIGSSLQAEVSITAPAADAAALRSLGDDLKFVFISSAAHVADGEALAIRVTPSAEPKCERCWHQRASVGQNAAHPGWCDRCVANVDGTGEVRSCA
ncbi:MAG: zinc finger domain-containing protein, partial [Fluviibacter sp.]